MVPLKHTHINTYFNTKLINWLIIALIIPLFILPSCVTSSTPSSWIPTSRGRYHSSIHILIGRRPGKVFRFEVKVHSSGHYREVLHQVLPINNMVKVYWGDRRKFYPLRTGGFYFDVIKLKSSSQKAIPLRFSRHKNIDLCSNFDNDSVLRKESNLKFVISRVNVFVNCVAKMDILRIGLSVSFCLFCNLLVFWCCLGKETVFLTLVENANCEAVLVAKGRDRITSCWRDKFRSNGEFWRKFLIGQ